MPGRAVPARIAAITENEERRRARDQIRAGASRPQPLRRRRRRHGPTMSTAGDGSTKAGEGQNPRTCRCGAAAAIDAVFCSACGARLDATAQPAAEGEAERRRISVLFADLTGFTSMTERFEPEVVRTITTDFLRIVTRSVESFGGRIEQYMGDGAMAVFGLPVADEFDAERAVRAARRIVEETAELRYTLVGSGEASVSSHVGVATGEALTANAAPELGITSPLGDAVNLAARLCSEAGPGEVVVCPVTARLVTGVVHQTSLGARPLKGKEQPVELSRVDAMTEKEPEPARSALAGRTAELVRLGAMITDAVERGSGGVCLVRGDAGVGKSRLLTELRERRADAIAGGRLRWLQVGTNRLGAGTPYKPIVDLVAALGGIDSDDDPPFVRASLDRLVEEGAAGRSDALGALHRLFDVEDATDLAADRETYQERLVAALVAGFEASCLVTPTVVAMEDLHWMDPSTLALVTQLVPRLESTTLFLLTSRRDRCPRLEFAAEVVDLVDLGVDDLERLVELRLGGPAAPGLVDLVQARTSGNPFFVEEVLSAMVDRALVVQTDGIWTIVDPTIAFAVPDTVQGVIASRVDRLSIDARRVVRHASVLGAQFSMAELEALCSESTDETGLEPAVAELVEAELLTSRAPAGGADVSLAFKHALILDVVHSGLATPDRRRLHRAAASVLEKRHGGRVHEHADILGLHYEHAGMVEPAVRHLRVAGRRALDRYAVDEANDRYERAYRLLAALAADDPRRRELGPLLTDWVLVHYYRGTWRSATDLLREHADEIEAAGDVAVEAMALAWRGFSMAIAHADVPHALSLLDRAAVLAASVDDAEALAHAHTWRAWVRFFAGRHDDALADGAMVETLLPRLADDRYPRIKSLGAVGLAHIGAGRPDDASSVATQMILIGEETGSTRSSSMGHALLCLRATVRGETDAACQAGMRAVAIANDPIYRDFARLMAIHALVAAGSIDTARRIHTELAASCGPLGLDGILLAAAPADGVLRILEGDLAVGRTTLGESITRCTETGNRFVAALAHTYREIVHARAVTREATVPTRALLRDPRFVVDVATSNRRKVSDRLRRLIAELPAMGGAGLRPLVELELGKLDVGHEKTLVSTMRRPRRRI
jgi:class 3 adenylate cyclase